MSDAEDSGFDKEAEREKLREKYENEQEDRQATQHMSELLLQGATMTNRHCDACGNPVFRYDGEEFCPVCGEESAEGTETGQEAGAEADGRASEQPRPDGQSPAQSQESTTAEAAQTRDRPTSEQSATPATRQAPTGPPAVPQRGETAGGLDEARASLVRTLTDLVRRAEEARDVGHTRELLAAAREAAEALSALDRTGR